ncbi:MAG: YceD family protein [Zoogloeaceae bacterium]|nr:YceD family protein [Zoogloeaceae bacterium]
MLDACRFARESGCLEGRLALSGLRRLADVLAQTEGGVDYRLSGVTGEQGQARLRLRVTGRLLLVCQRCLDAVAHDLSIDRLLELAPEDSAPAQEEMEDDSVDVLPLDGMLEVDALIEDELLLSLPIAPRHAECVLPVAAADSKKAHPFAALAALEHH